MQKIKDLLESRLSGILLGLVVLQPVLDVFSYFLGIRGSNAISTLLRFGLLALVALLGFLLSNRKWVYLTLYGAIALFWAAHMLNCFRIGYTSPVQDTGNLLRLLNFPLYALSFITALEGRPHLRKTLCLGVAIAFLEIILFTALPWAIGRPVYTYDNISVGVLGWFLIPSAQSAVIVLTAPFIVFAAYKSGKYPLYLLGALLPVALMFVTGTKLDFFSIFIMAGAYIFLFALQLGKRSLRYVLPLAALLVLTVAFRGQSPMAVRDGMTAYSQNVYNSMIADTLSRSDQSAESELPPEDQLEGTRRMVQPIYSDEGVYGFRTRELNERFGMYNVMEVYEYTDMPSSLSDVRQCKLNYAQLVWHEKDTLTHFLGFEYSDFLLGENIYDLENDFPGVFYGVGYLGFALYLLFFAVFFYHVFRALAGDIQRAAALEHGAPPKAPKPLLWLKSFWLGLRSFLTVEMGAVGMSFLLAVIAAQISGNVLRRPNVTIYFAIAAACLYSLTAHRSGRSRNASKESPKK